MIYHGGSRADVVMWLFRVRRARRIAVAGTTSGTITRATVTS